VALKPRHGVVILWGAVGATLAGAGPAVAPPAGGTSITRVSVDSSGAQGNGFSLDAAISADGRVVAFDSDASNLVPGDTNAATDILVHDRATGQTSRVSVDSTGAQANDDSFFPAMSADGGFVAFESLASNLVPGDTNAEKDVFVNDLQTGQTSRVSIDGDGVQGNLDSRFPAISGDGRFVAFESFAYNLAAGDTDDGALDVFVHDRQTGETVKVSVNSSGAGGDAAGSSDPAISANGGFVAFRSSASDLVAGDTNSRADIFVHDLTTAQTSRVSVDSTGDQANGDSSFPRLNADGRSVSFQSQASDLVAGDTNGVADVFIHDRQAGQTIRASLDGSGGQGNGASVAPTITANGRSVAFHSQATNLAAGDTNGVLDVFVRNTQTGETTRVSVNGSGAEGNGSSRFPAISGDGHFVAFHSNASNLVAGDTNGAADVFVHDRGDVLDVVVNGQTRAAAGDRTVVAKVTNAGSTAITVSDADVAWSIRVGASACDGSGNLTTGSIEPLNPGSTTLEPGRSATFRYRWTFGAGEVSSGTGIAYRAVFTPFGWGDCEFEVAR
jgi:hypothetical protein